MKREILDKLMKEYTGVSNTEFKIASYILYGSIIILIASILISLIV